MRSMAFAAVLGMAALFSCCGDDIQFSAPPDKGSTAAANPHQHLPAGHPPMSGAGSGEAAPAPAGGHGGDPFADPKDAGKDVRGDGGAPALDPEKVYFTGRVELSPDFKLPPTYAIFVNAGHPPQGSPPVLSHRFPDQPKFPLAFELRGKDIAFGDTKVDAPLVLYVILSESGFIERRGVYVKKVHPEPRAPGTQDIVLTLSP